MVQQILIQKTRRKEEAFPILKTLMFPKKKDVVLFWLEQIL